ncbi:hypothetical protein ABZZ80_44585, partial [Streptomyces sp. NPDC006356]
MSSPAPVVPIPPQLSAPSGPLAEGEPGDESDEEPEEGAVRVLLAAPRAGLAVCAALLGRASFLARPGVLAASFAGALAADFADALATAFAGAFA